MKKLGRKSVDSIVDRAIQEFMKNLDSPELISFFWKGHNVEAYFEWSPSSRTFFLSEFLVIYSNCVMRYKCDEDFDLSIAWVE